MLRFLATVACASISVAHIPSAQLIASPRALACVGPAGPCGRRIGAVSQQAWLRKPVLQPRSRAALAIRDEARAAVPVETEMIDEVSYREALVQTALIAAAACAFGTGIWVTKGQDMGFQFFAGYVIEESLSIDNLFVFKLIFDFFAVKGVPQRKVLNYGIWAAAIFRFIMISLGVEAVESFRPVLLVFAAILILSSGSILAESFSGEKEEPDLASNPVVKLCKQLLPTTDQMDGDRFFTLGADGARLATPLLVALMCIEVSDVVFAVDSVPAVLGVTSDRFIAFTSNMFAIFGLRALFRVLATLVNDFEYLQPAVALVLGFVGAKMVAEFYGAEISIATSLGVIMGILVSGVGLSILLPPETLPDVETDELED